MMKMFSVIGIVIGLLFAIIGLTTTVPDDIIQTGTFARGNREQGGYQEYVGGDAYNFIIEASIRGGEIAGGRTARATYLTGGVIMITGSLISLGASLDQEKKVKAALWQDPSTGEAPEPEADAE